jgi:hypothetical protein
MEVLSTAINAVVVAAVGLILGWLSKGRLDRLEARIALAVVVRPEAEAGGG